MVKTSMRVKEDRRKVKRDFWTIIVLIITILAMGFAGYLEEQERRDLHEDYVKKY